MSVARALVVVIAACGQESTATPFDFETSQEPALVLALTPNNVLGSYPTTAIASPSGSVIVALLSSRMCGDVFRLEPDDEPTDLFQFPSAEGCSPQSLALGGDGSVYAGTQHGSVVRIASDNSAAVLRPSDSDFVSSLVVATDGALYGALTVQPNADRGEIFTIAATGELTVVREFPDELVDALAAGSDGTIIGTSHSVSLDSPSRVFSLTPDGELTGLKDFDSGELHVLITASDGALWGTRETFAIGGTSIYRLASDGTTTIVHTFVEGIDGASPTALVEAGDGNFYGTTRTAGVFGFGTLFRMAPDGTGAVLHSFTGQNVGGSPNALVLANGSLVGIASEGVFRFGL